MTRYERLIASAHHRKTIKLNVPILKHALDKVQNSFTVCRDRSAAFQAVRSTTAGRKPALRTVNLAPETLS